MNVINLTFCVRGNTAPVLMSLFSVCIGLYLLEARNVSSTNLDPMHCKRRDVMCNTEINESLVVEFVCSAVPSILLHGQTSGFRQPSPRVNICLLSSLRHPLLISETSCLIIVLPVSRFLSSSLLLLFPCFFTFVFTRFDAVSFFPTQTTGLSRQGYQQWGRRQGEGLKMCVLILLR